MEDLYCEIFGKKPAKKGTAYELIVGAVLKLLNQDANITHNVFVKSPYSTATYQADNLCETDKMIFVEAKDYSGKSKKVGRGDISKLAGALCVLKDTIDSGILASSTEFTKPAKQFSSDFLKANGILIDLLVIRKCLPADTENTIQKIVVNMNMLIPNNQRAEFAFVWTKESPQVLESLGYKEGDAICSRIQCFYRRDRSVIETIRHLISKLDVDYEKLLATGQWEFDEPAYIDIDETLVPIKRLDYNIPYVIDKRTIEIDAGKPAILVSSTEGGIWKIITFEDLRTMSVKENDSYSKKHGK